MNHQSALRTPKTVDHLRTKIEAFESVPVALIIEGYVARYPAAYQFTLQFEGGYVDDPDDPGGCTNKGITIGTLTAWRQDSGVTCQDVKNLSPTEAALIYATNYWAPVWGNKMDVGINTQVWDFGVNAGPHRAIETLQGIVGSPADGVMGPNTLSAVDGFIDDNGIDPLLSSFHDSRQRYYESLSTFSKYGNGWTRRNDDCLTLSRDLAGKTITLPTLPALPDRPDGDIDARVSALEDWAGSFKRD